MWGPVVTRVPSNHGDVYISCGEFGSVSAVRLDGVRVLSPQYRSVYVEAGGAVSDLVLHRCESAPGMAPIAVLICEIIC